MEGFIGIFTLTGFNFTFWSLVGLVRFLSERFPPRVEKIASFDLSPIQQMRRIQPREVAAIVPAHNEESVIARTIAALKEVVPAENIYIGSDASTDLTVPIARGLGVHVEDIWPNKGKANMLVHLLRHCRLLGRYKAIMIVDADSEVDRHYLECALPLFDDPKIAAIAVHALSRWENHQVPNTQMFFIAYRVRFYRILQAVFRYGQTWKFTSVTPIVPGFASMYRTAALRHIEINAPGLAIEDFNMTFELHHKKLGRVAYSPRVKGITDDPQNLKDYIKQVRRWNLGFWQTVRRHGIWPGKFWFALSAFLIEMLTFAFVILSVPLLLLHYTIVSFEPIPIPNLLTWSATYVAFDEFLMSIFLMDYVVTLVVAIYEKKPMMLVYGLGFIVVRLVDAFLLLYTLPLAFMVRSDGRWVSPKRYRTVGGDKS